MASGMNQTLMSPVRRYLNKATSIEYNGSICLRYRKGNLRKVIKLMKLEWHPAHGTDKWFQPPNKITGTPLMSLSRLHKVKGFADDLTIFLSSSNDHTEALKVISDFCHNLNLKYDGNKIIRSSLFTVGIRVHQEYHVKTSQILWKIPDLM